MENNSTDYEEPEIKDYRIILYRLDHLENEQKENFKELMKMLQTMQEGLNDTTRTLIVHEGKLNSIEEKSKCLDTLKDETTAQAQQIKTLYSRLATYRQILLGVGVGVLVALLIEIVKFI